MELLGPSLGDLLKEHCKFSLGAVLLVVDQMVV
jgi:hypothetical protein